MKTLFLIGIMLTSCHANPKHAKELGTVKWTRDLSVALEASKKSDKPVFLLFQEVPG